MAINIKEVLHPTDSDSIKWGKVNYNFDQILANGGGPTGPKGEKGIQGDQGLTGLKGGKGDKGEIGLKGEVGVTDSPWGVIEHVSGDAVILKPKTSIDVDGDGTPTQYLNFAALYLGDSSYDETTNAEGVNDSNARLTLEKEDGIFDEYIRFRHASNKNARITSVVDGGYTEFRFLKDLGNTDIAFKMDLDKITLLANSSEFLIQGQQIRLKPLADTNIVFETDGAGILDVDMPVTIRDYTNFDTTSAIKFPVGDDSQRPGTPLQGMTRYNTENNAFEGYYGAAWKPIGGLQDTDGDTYITAEETANDNIIRIYIGGTTSDEVVKIGDVQNDGVNNFNKAILAKQDLFVNTGKKIVFLGSNDGPAYAAKSASSGLQPPNYGSAIDRRTIHDYFYRSSVVADDSVVTSTDTSPFDNSYASGSQITRTIETTVDKISTDLFYTHRRISAVGDEAYPKTPVSVMIDTVASKISYTKVGHQVSVWGNITFWPHPVNYQLNPAGSVNFRGQTTGTSESSAAKVSRIGIFPAQAKTWPYRNVTSGQKVIFPITVSLQGLDYVSPTALSEENMQYYGVIFPGQACFNIMQVKSREVTIPGTSPEAAGTSGIDPNNWTATYMNLEDFSAAWNLVGKVTLEFNFVMPTNDDSFDQPVISTVRAMYTEDGSISLAGINGGPAGGN